MQCCDKNVTTKFCPDCGQANDQTPPLERLLAYCQSTYKRMIGRTQAATSWANGPGSGESSEEKHHTIKRAELIEDKWASWCEALAEVVRKEQADAEAQD